MQYNVGILCAHCGALTHLDRMDEARYESVKPGLAGVLHSLACGHCGRRFGAGGGQIVKEPESR